MHALITKLIYGVASKVLDLMVNLGIFIEDRFQSKRNKYTMDNTLLKVESDIADDIQNIKEVDDTNI